jgi:hypothetical protein
VTPVERFDLKHGQGGGGEPWRRAEPGLVWVACPSDQRRAASVQSSTG